jgi:hypothetical protein
MSPTAAMNVAATITLTPGTVSSRLTCGQDSASAAMSWSTSPISESRKSTTALTIDVGTETGTELALCTRNAAPS